MGPHWSAVEYVSKGFILQDRAKVGALGRAKSSLPIRVAICGRFRRQYDKGLCVVRP
jgi:hypothetical protein